jgi:hypothetical protein
MLSKGSQIGLLCVLSIYLSPSQYNSQVNENALNAGKATPDESNNARALK